MSGRSLGSTFLRIVEWACVVACLVLTLGSAAASAFGPSKSPLPGYPRFRGVMLVHDGSSASVARERAITSALKAASSSTTPNCGEGKENPGADLCWWGGPVVGAHKVHLIFWEGTALEGHPIPAAYREAVEGYFERVEAANGTNSNVYAVQAQYGGSSGAGVYQVSFGGKNVDVFRDLNPLPSAGAGAGQCTDVATPNGICVTDKDLREQIELAQAVENIRGHHWESTLHDIYFVFTPSEVGSCFYGGGEGVGANSCSFESGGYCAYHSSFENANEELVPPLYANIPDNGNVEGCDSFEHPNGGTEGVDGTLDTMSHEHNETITDPLGNGWLDVIGQEIGDKCLPPETFDIYGGAIKGVPATESKGAITPGTLYNQIIGSGHYWLQREWSNSAFEGEGGCVQRMVNMQFTPPSGAKATVPAAFDGSASGEVGDQIAYWEWDFGDEVNGGEFLAVTTKPTIDHTYAFPGNYAVTLTAFDVYGNSNTRTMTVEVGAAPPAESHSGPLSSPAPAALTNTVTVATPTPPVLKYTAEQMATLLGLPQNGKTLLGLGTMDLGKAECPPACAVTLKMYAKVKTVSHKHRVTKLVLVGQARRHGMPKGAVFVRFVPGVLGELLLSLNAKGRALLHKHRLLACKLAVTVEGQEGGSWTITRSLKLKR